MVHVIKEGETLYQLSRMYRVPVALILRANPYVDVYNLQVGQEICIPVGRPVFPGMMPPFGRPPRRNMENPPMREPTPRENESAVTIPSEESMTDEMRDDVEESQEMPYLIMDGRKSLGSVLREENMSLSELMEMNDADRLILAEGVRIYLPKKV